MKLLLNLARGKHHIMMGKQLDIWELEECLSRFVGLEVFAKV
jgi:hypothetical protein